MSAYRVYEPHELGPDGYPLAWHESIKHEVRAEAGHRCVRCGHPFIVGQSGVMEGPCAEAKSLAADLGMNVEVLDRAFEEFAGEAVESVEKAKRTNWSPCDRRCTHGGPIRYSADPPEEDFPFHGWTELPETPLRAGDVARSWAQVQAAWRILTVHHLDGVKANCRWWNLLACCQRCHLGLQRRVVMEQVYPFEHSDYFKPYAAGFYAHTYLGEDLTRDETMERLDELLGLERVRA